MGLQVTYRPPAVNGLVRMALAKEAVETAGAVALLKAALPLVPIDSGALYASGTVEHYNGSAAVLFSSVNFEGRHPFDYAATVHERMDVEHDHGQSKFLEKPMHSDGPVVLAAMAKTVAELL